tara:strand:+ start:143 stop:1171 length:1029 start_codon:yes stop_codon:yes gene_type:complete
MKHPLSYVAVSGFGWSGSSAVVDLLREFEGYISPGFEFSLIKEPYGIIDLENFLVDNWDVIRHDHAIKLFLEFCKILNRPYSYVGKWGLNIGVKLNTNFLQESYNYIDKLSDFTYKGNSRIDHYSLNNFQSLFKKIQRRMGISSASIRTRIFSKPDSKKFIEETQLYINNLFLEFANNNNCSNIILDQAIPTSNISRSLRYFERIKLILVDRDPRDIYIDLINQKAMLGQSYSDKEMLDKYLIWHTKIRSNIYEINSLKFLDGKILQVKFEDLIINYEATREMISNFLNISAIKTKHNCKLYFDPVRSNKNIELWKSWANQDEMELIKNRLIDNKCKSKYDV